MSQQILDEIEGRQFKESLPEFRAGDTLRVGVRVVEGSRERVQEFEGVVIRSGVRTGDGGTALRTALQADVTRHASKIPSHQGFQGRMLSPAKSSATVSRRRTRWACPPSTMISAARGRVL